MDGLWLKTGINGIVPAITVGGRGIDVRGSATASHVSALGRSTADNKMEAAHKTTPFRFSFRYPLQSLWPGGGGGKDRRRNGLALDDAVLVENGDGLVEAQNGNWILNILHVRSLWGEDGHSENKEEKEAEEKINDAVSNNVGVSHADSDDEEDEEECDMCAIDDDDEKSMKFDRESFSKLLKKVSLAEAKMYAQMSYLGNLAYAVSKIKPGNLLKHHGLRFVTSSVEKRELAAKFEEGGGQEPEKLPEEENEEVKDSEKEPENTGYGISASTAYQIAVSAASYLQTHSMSLVPFKSSKPKSSTEGIDNSNTVDNAEAVDSDVASVMATTDSVTSVVAAKEEVKQAVADDLKSSHSSPCDWFICDDDRSCTRFFVIQGSESLASWKANLLFEPVEFEGFDVLVHRGIYEAAKGMYEQMLPEIQNHLKMHGNRALFRFTGHSLGGSLSLLVNLMLLIRGEVPASSLLPVVTFGAPSIMCGGDRFLRKLGLPKSHVRAITMHRDIVPRAFSCSYPNHVAELLKAVNKNFRKHPCLSTQKLLYAPMGELLILQPDEKFSPQHDLLPSGSGLYFLTCPLSDVTKSEKQLRGAQTVFLNSPHPLEILSDRTAYGSEGTIQRDHDMNSYLKSLRFFIRQELGRMRKAKREQQQRRRKLWWPILVSPERHGGSSVVGRRIGMVTTSTGGRGNFSGIVSTGRENLRRFSRLVASQHMHLLVILLFPAKLLVLGAYGFLSLR